MYENKKLFFGVKNKKNNQNLKLTFPVNFFRMNHRSGKKFFCEYTKVKKIKIRTNLKSEQRSEQNTSTHLLALK